MSIEHNSDIRKSGAEYVEEAVHPRIEWRDIALAVIVVAVAAGSFALGRMSTASTVRPVVISYSASEPEQVSADTRDGQQGASVLPAVTESSGIVVASRNGTKYHYPWCSGALRIKDENKVTYASIDEARRAGLEPAANCKGLK